MKKVISLLIIVIITSACGTAQATEYKADSQRNAHTPINRFIDNEAGVVCYWFSYTKTGGIDCLPIDETKLKK